MADNVCPYCGFPNENGVKICVKCKKAFSLADFSHVITDEISISEEKATIVEKTDIDFSEEEGGHKEKKADIRFDSEEDLIKPTQPINSSQIISKQFYAATFLQRIGSLFIDLIIVFFCTLIIWFAGTSLSLNPNLLFEKNNLISTTDIVISFLILYFLFGFFYSMLFHHLSSRTIGKMLFGLYLVEKNSYRVSFHRVLLRNLFFILNIITLFIGFIWIIADERGQALHDKLSGTFVISEEII